MDPMLGAKCGSETSAIEHPIQLCPGERGGRRRLVTTAQQLGVEVCGGTAQPF